MSAEQETQTPRERKILYIVAAAIGLVLVILGLILFDSAKDNREAEAKADQFITALGAAGAQTLPSRDQVVRVLGTDGGATCENPNAPLNRAILRSQLSNGATGPGNRPVVFDRTLLAGQLLILKVYCPDELPSMQEYVDSLKSDDVAK